jgi:DNA-binding transcriptional regulator GbsR (MarR family)
MVLTEKQKQLIQKIGIANEKHGMQPAAARIIGLLYVSDKPELTFEEIGEALHISKSATSNALNLLMQTDRIEYTTVSGDRKRYFRLKISNWKDGFTKEMESLTNFSQLIMEVLAIRTSETPEFNKSLAELKDFLIFINQELPLLMEKWKKSRES